MHSSQRIARQFDLVAVVEAGALGFVGSIDDGVGALIVGAYFLALIFVARLGIDSVTCELDALEDTETTGLTAAFTIHDGLASELICGSRGRRLRN